MFNCTAGKDRTGVAAALLLSALGVPREIILQDYLLTEQFFDRSCEMILKETDKARFTGADRSIWEPTMRARPEYLNAMFDQLQESQGSVEGYLKDQLGIVGMAIDRLRSELLEWAVTASAACTKKINDSKQMALCIEPPTATGRNIPRKYCIEPAA